MNSVDPQAPRIQALERRREELMAERSKLVTWRGPLTLRAGRGLQLSDEIRQIEKTLQAINGRADEQRDC